MQNGAALFVDAAARLGLDTIFTLVGDHLNEVLACAAQAGLRIIDMRHESGVTHAADAWARIHRRPALALVTGGPGHTNALTGIATANLAGSPLIAVSGSRARGLADRNAFQDIDQVAMARPVVKWAAEVPEASQIPFYLRRAYTEANSDRRGAVHLTIPVDVFTSPVAHACSVPCRESSRHGPGPTQMSATSTQMSMLHAASVRHEGGDILRAARRPIAIAGSGAWWSGAETELRDFIERSRIPLYTITMARGIVSDDHPLCMGYADPALNYAVHRAFREADVFLILGKRIDYRLALGGARLFPADAKFVQIDIHPQELGLNRALDAAICGDLREALMRLDAPPTSDDWLDRNRALRAEWRAKLDASTADAAVFFRALREALPDDVLFSWDGGDFAHWGRAILPARHPGGWLRLGPLGTIGSSLPNAVALKLAHPDRRVVAITGDGALGFYLAEMDTLVRHKLPIVLIVGNDAGWGLERELQGGSNTVACELSHARYDQVMRAFGGDGETIERPDEVRPAIERAFASGVPYCINVKIRGARSPFTDWQIAGKKKA